jgi:hypothetical protein
MKPFGFLSRIIIVIQEKEILVNDTEEYKIIASNINQ